MVEDIAGHLGLLSCQSCPWERPGIFEIRRDAQGKREREDGDEPYNYPIPSNRRDK